MRGWIVGLAVLAAALGLAGAARLEDGQRRVHPVVDVSSGYLLGGTVNGAWRDGKALAPLLRGGERYRVYGAGGALGASPGTRPRVIDEICSETFLVRVRPARDTAGIAVGGEWNALPRPVARLDPAGAVYREAVREIVARNGIRNPQVRITRLLRADLDGDGRDEVIGSATRGRSDVGIRVEAGDYSLVFVRTVVGGAVRTLALAEEYYPAASNEKILNTHTIAAVLDLDGDGTMEVVTRGDYYEGDWGTIHRVRGGRKEELASAGCGV
jgi:hypothetical protein